MSKVSLALINNIEKANLIQFITNRCDNLTKYEGMSIENKLSGLISDKIITLKEANEFLFDELFCGMHRDVNIYRINSFRKAKYTEDWIDKYLKNYGISDVNINMLIETYATSDSDIKIAAIKTVFNDKNEVKCIRIIFIKEIKLVKGQSETTTSSYIPVEINLIKKIIVVKGRQRQKIVHDNHKHRYLMDKIFNDIISKMEISIIPFNELDERTLYTMSKSSLDALLNKIPAFQSLGTIKDDVNKFVKEIIEKLPFVNKEGEELNKGIMIDSEVITLIEEIVLTDYFFDKDDTNIWDFGVDSIITSITFNDSKNATARLSGEGRKTHIFNSKSFMGLRKSLQMVKEVQALKVAFRTDEKALHVKYTADNDLCLNILFSNYEPYCEKDFKLALEMYIKHEEETIRKTEELYKRKLC